MSDDIQTMIESIPAETPRRELATLLEPVLDAVARLGPPEAEAYLSQIRFRFGLAREEIAAYRRMLRQKQKDLEETPSVPKTVMTADFPGLVDLVLDEARVKFLVRSGLDLALCDSHEHEGVIYIPPPQGHIPWLLPRGKEVLRWYRQDSDRGLYMDLWDYFHGVSELPSDSFYDLLVTWVFHTHLLDRAQYSPYLWLYGVPERGKTRTGKAAIFVARRGIHVESLREAYLLRAAQDLGASLFIDVMDLYRKLDRAGSEDILLLRIERGARVARVLNPDKGPFNDTTYYEIFGPTIIGTNELIHHIMATRAVRISLPEAHRHFEDDVTAERGRPYRERLVAFRARHLGQELRPMAKPARGRLGDILRPLLQIAHVAHPGRVQILMDLFQDLQAARLRDKAESLEAQILEAVQELEPEATGGLLPVGRITDNLNEVLPDREKVTSQKVGRRLDALGFEKTRTERNCVAIVWDPEHLARVMAAHGLRETPETPETPGPLSHNDLEPGESDGESGVSSGKLRLVTPSATTDSESPGVSGVSGRVWGEDFHALTRRWSEDDWDRFSEQSGLLIEAGLQEWDADWQAAQVVNVGRWE